MKFSPATRRNYELLIVGAKNFSSLEKVKFDKKMSANNNPNKEIRPNALGGANQPLVATRTPSQDRGKNFDLNLYATKKSAAQGLLDLALLMANAAQLKHIILMGTDHRFFIAMMILLCTSIGLQIIVGVALLILAKIRITVDMVNEEEYNDATHGKLKRVDFLNNLVVIGIFILTVINVFISAFGLNEAPKPHFKA